MTDAWFVIPVMPGILSQIAGYFKGSSGTYKVARTVEGNPLYNQYMAAGYGPPYSSYAAATAAARQFAATGSANALPGAGGSAISPGSSANQGPSLTGLAAIGDFFSRLTQASTWERAGEVILGLILIGVGISRITGAGNIATRVATKGLL